MVLEEEKKSLKVECENIDVEKKNVDVEEGELTDEEETPYERILKEVKDLKKKDLNIWNDIAKNYSVPYQNSCCKYSEKDIPEIDPYGEEVQYNCTDTNNLVFNDLTIDEIDLIFQRRAKLMENSYSPMEQFKRPRMCKYFRDGFCRDGEKCFFSHLLEDSNRKTRLCKFYEYTSCNQSSTCSYWHGEFPCYKFHILKNCMKDKFCKYSHEPLSPYAKEVLEEYEKERFGYKDIDKKKENIKLDTVNFDNPQMDIDFRIWIPKLELSVDQIKELIKDEKNQSGNFDNFNETLTEIDDSFNIRNIFNSMKVESHLMGKKDSLNWVSAIKHDLSFEKNKRSSSRGRFKNEYSKNSKRSYEDTFLEEPFKKPKSLPFNLQSSCDKRKSSKSYDRKKVNHYKNNRNNFGFNYQ
ncbi:Zinc finger, CCCH-type domain-containing protein [Strongyloides ratti]|uniref:Zinc finger, CCCH-type domain-containing protein n=1 Tax=Strongyloides ratti TaxID=34506 RepID=A0A090LJL7_STRRB|nr:Zinc finger, CCCH-type domain-containing protein [Strongyloides ratti]CEF68318.1 Zinc finger, CCCH-type domain-containing protein [Strongyloides ratti]